MIDPRILQALASSDVETRKKAVAYLAKSLDRDALPHLAKVYKSDPSSEIRELAKRAGAYIQKNAPQTPISEIDDEPDEAPAYSRYGSLYDEDDNDEQDEADDDIPLPSDLEVSAVAQERAKSFVEQALDWNVRGNNEKAVEFLKRAFKTNPRLLYDTYTMGLASDITGLTQPQARRMLAPSAKELAQMGGSSAVTSSPLRRLNPIQQFFAFCIFLGATAALIGFFALPWVDLGWIPVPQDSIAGIDLSGVEGLGIDLASTQTLGGALSEGQRLLNEQIRPFESQLGTLGAQGELLRRALNGLRGIRTNMPGMDVMLVMIGSQDLLRAFGFGGIIDALLDILSDPALIGLASGLDTGQLGIDASQLDGNNLRFVVNVALEQLKYVPQAVDFSIIAVPVAGSFGFLLALLLLMSPNGWSWVLCILFGLAGVGACAYFYTTGINRVFLIGAEGVSMQDLVASAGATNFITQSIGLGFWVALGGMITVAIAPFLGLLFAPAKQTA